MSLAVGSRLGSYEVVSLLGAGGMGEVYRARDLRLGRLVALKVLPQAFTADSERLARFEREARLLATLNHPHIGAIYGVEQEGDLRGIVLELVEGHTLAAALRVGPMAVRDALEVARQIALALEAAHEKGIVHRDLKPANVTTTSDDVVKVLDFGLAKASVDEPLADLSHSPTMTSDGTRHGVILGTAAYMSPEQARGRAVDKRTDIWAFGCVLYELLTAHVAFGGETVSDTIGAILHTEPQWNRLPAATPPAVHRLLQRCLEKDPKRRLHDIADARIEIEDALTQPAATDLPVVRRSRPAWKLLLGTLAGVVAGAALVFFGGRYLTAPIARDVVRFAIAFPPELRLGPGIALSPDGRTLVYSGTDVYGTRLYRRRVDALDSIPIRGSEGGRLPFFSPDGLTVGFTADRALKTVPLAGGAATTLTESRTGGDAAAWLPDNTIAFTIEGSRGLQRVPASGGNPQVMTVLDDKQGELSHLWPLPLPRAKGVLFTIHYGAQETQRVHAASLAGERRVPVVQGNGARYLPTGHVVFHRGGALWVAPFDADRLELTGTPTAVVENVAIAPDWSPIFTVGGDGSLAYATGGVEPFPPRSLVWVDKTGRETPIEAPARNWWWPQVSPDGKRLGFHIMDPVNMDAWIYELESGPLIRMTYAAHQDGFPLWSPDGKHVAFWSRQSTGSPNLYLRSSDLRGEDRRLTDNTEFTYFVPSTWADGGKLLVFHTDSATTGLDIGVVPVDRSAAPRLIIEGPSDESKPAMSPDGRWIAYQSNSSGRSEIYVQPFPDLSGRWQVSPSGGASPLWSVDGRELFYRNDRSVLSVPITVSGSQFTYGNPRELFAGSYVPESSGPSDARSYAVAPDGRFLMMKERDGHERQSQTRQIVVIVNWAEELARR